MTGVSLALRRRTRSTATLFLLLPGAAFLLVLFIVPVAGLVLESLSDPAGTWVHYHHILAVPVYLLVLGRTVLISGVTAVLCLLLGFPVAYRLSHAKPWVKGIILL